MTIKPKCNNLQKRRDTTYVDMVTHVFQTQKWCWSRLRRKWIVEKEFPHKTTWCQTEWTCVSRRLRLGVSKSWATTNVRAATQVLSCTQPLPSHERERPWTGTAAWLRRKAAEDDVVQWPNKCVPNSERTRQTNFVVGLLLLLLLSICCRTIAIVIRLDFYIDNEYCCRFFAANANSTTTTTRKSRRNVRINNRLKDDIADFWKMCARRSQAM